MRAISILIVEDEAITALFMEAILMRNGYHVLKCISSGEDAVDFTLKFKPDLVIMDIRLAGIINGIEAVRQIKESNANLAKFIFTTGYSDPDIKEEAMNLEPLAFMVKPIQLPELVKIIQNNFFNDNNVPGDSVD